MAHKPVSIMITALVLVLTLTLPGVAGADNQRIKGDSASHRSSSWFMESWLGSLLARLLPGKLTRSTAPDSTDPNGASVTQSTCEPSPFPPPTTTDKGSSCDPNG